MRLTILERGHRWPARVFQRVAAVVFREQMDDVVRTALHRPQFFGAPFLRLVTEVLRGPSYWTVGEREFMAAHVSRLNECPFCVRVHTETARIESRGEVDVETGSSHRPELRAVLTLLEKLASATEEVSPTDIEAVYAAGVPEEAIVDALDVKLIFDTINRLANAFGFSWRSEQHVRTGARAIHRFNYRLPSFVLR